MPLRETLEKIRTLSTPPNEETVKMWIMVPILQELGWPSYDIHWEYAVGQGKGRVDAALKGPRGVAAFIEAKAPGHSLDDHVEQVLGYAFQEGANICALTTGLEWWLYLPAETDYPFPERRFAELRLKKDPVDQLAVDFEAFLGREPLVNGEAVKKAKQVLKARREAEHLDKEVPAIWRGMLTAPDEELIELVSKRVYEKTNLRPAKQQVEAALGMAPMNTPVLAAPISTNKQVEAAQGTTPTLKRKSSRALPPKGMKLWGQYREVKSWIGILNVVVDALYERHGKNFEPAFKLNYKGQPYVSRKASDIDRPRQVKNRALYLDRNLGRSEIIQRANEFLDAFGYESSDLEIFE